MLFLHMSLFSVSGRGTEMSVFQRKSFSRYLFFGVLVSVGRDTAGAIPGTMRETLLIISDSEAATTAVLKGNICRRTGRSGSLSSVTTLCRVSFAVFLLRAPPAERERAHSKCAKTGVGGKGVST